eukprot:2041032-Prymnesium_polylepis.1
MRLAKQQVIRQTDDTRVRKADDTHMERGRTEASSQILHAASAQPCHISLPSTHTNTRARHGTY